MNSIYNHDYMLNIGPGGISLVAIDAIHDNAFLCGIFEVQIDMENFLYDNFARFYKILMEKLSEELLYKIMEGKIINGDLLRLYPTTEGKKILIKVSIFRVKRDIYYDLHLFLNSIKNMDNTIKEKKEEIEYLRRELNKALDNKDYYLCKDIIQKINHIKNEFLL